jgi:putative hemolysin
MLLVVDEYGEVQGLITPRDLLEAITGELKPDTPLDAWATPEAGGRWMLDGMMPVNELKARLGIRELPDEDRGRYNTVAGLVLYGLGELPRPGAVFRVEGWSFEVLSMEGRRIDQVRATPMFPPR